MPKLPNAERVEVPIEKLRDYALNPLHDEGKHKARVFLATLGFTYADAETLRELVERAGKRKKQCPANFCRRDKCMC